MTQKCSFLETVAAAAACDYRVPCSTCNVNTCCQRPPPKHPSLWLKSPEYTQSYAAAAAPFNWMKKLGFYIHMEHHSTTHVHLEILGIYSIYYRKRLYWLYDVNKEWWHTACNMFHETGCIIRAKHIWLVIYIATLFLIYILGKKERLFPAQTDKEIIQE